MRVVIAALHNS